MRHRSRRDASAFTLVELLAVLAIIMLLIALLMPALRKARRKAIILVSPIAYVGIDQRVYVIPQSGGVGVDVAQANVADPGWHQVHLAWSPSGTKIALHSIERTPVAGGGNRGNYMTYVIEPMESRLLRHRESNWLAFRCWKDSSSFISISTHGDRYDGRRGFRRRDADSGTIVQHLVTQPWFYGSPSQFHLAPLSPSHTRYRYVGIDKDPNPLARTTVRLWTKDLRPGRVIWRSGPSDPDLNPFPSPQSDLTGEWLAWTQYSWKEGPKGVALKKLSADVDVPPVVLFPKEFSQVVFCDWTEHGQLLVNACRGGAHPSYMHGGNWQLLVLDRDGRIMREIPTDTPPYPGSVASWRKHMHY